MDIHILRPKGGIAEMCQTLAISEENTRRINDIEGYEAAPGEELLGLVPTRYYRAVYGDTIEKIALRFGLTRKELLLANPWLSGREITKGETITLRYGQRCHGMKVANGYYHEGTSDESLKRALPYLTYVTFSSAVADRHGVRRIMSDSRQVDEVVKAGKIPLIRIHDTYHDRFLTNDNHGFADSLIKMAKEGNYKGIVLNSSPFSHSASEYSAFLVSLRKLMIGCDLILITEIDEETPIEFSEYADGCMIYYPKYAMNNPPSFADGERRIFSDFACRGESAKAFIDLSCLAKATSGYCGMKDALELARRNRYEITHNESTLLSHFRDRKQGEYTFQSLSGLKAIFDLIYEFDYMGICIDITNIPTSFLMMYNALFKTCYQVSGGM